MKINPTISRILEQYRVAFDDGVIPKEDQLRIVLNRYFDPIEYTGAAFFDKEGNLVNRPPPLTPL